MTQSINKCCDSNAICARLGGDEFIICSIVSGNRAAESPAARPEQKLSELDRITHKPYKLSAGMGSIVKVLEP